MSLVDSYEVIGCYKTYKDKVKGVLKADEISQCLVGCKELRSNYMVLANDFGCLCYDFVTNVYDMPCNLDEFLVFQINDSKKVMDM